MCHNGIMCASPSRNEKHADRRTNHSAAGRLVTRLARTLPVNCAVCPPGQSVSSDCPDSRGHIGIPTGCWVSDARARPAPRDQLVRPRRSTRARSIVDGHGKTWSLFGKHDTVSQLLFGRACMCLDRLPPLLLPGRLSRCARHPWLARLSASSTRSQLEAAASSSQSDFGLCAS